MTSRIDASAPHSASSRSTKEPLRVREPLAPRVSGSPPVWPYPRSLPHSGVCEAAAEMLLDQAALELHETGDCVEDDARVLIPGITVIGSKRPPLSRRDQPNRSLRRQLFLA